MTSKLSLDFYFSLDIVYMLKGKLRKSKEISDMVSLITLLVKEEFKHLDLKDYKVHNDLVLFIMSHVEEKSQGLSKKTRKSIDKNELVALIFREIYGEDITDEDLRRISDAIEFILDRKLIKVTSWVVKKGVSFFCGVVGQFSKR
jgi:hypothetical protein